MESGMKRRIGLQGLPVDDFSIENMNAFIIQCNDSRNHQIVFLDDKGFRRASSISPWRSTVQGAELVIPTSKAVAAALKKAGLGEVTVHEPFRFTVSLLGALEARSGTLYLAGGTARELVRAERRIASTFPGIRIVGRLAGGYDPGQEGAIMAALRKASPDLVLAGNGLPGEEAWIPATMNRLTSGIYLWCGEVFTVFASGKR